MEHRQGIVGAEEETILKFRMMPEMQQHPDPVGEREGGDVGVKMWIPLRERMKGGQELFVQHQAVTAGMGRNDGRSFIECRAEPVRVTDGLVFSDQAELETHVAQ